MQIDHDAGRRGSRTVLELGLHGDVRQAQRAVLPGVGAERERAHLDRGPSKRAKPLETVVSACTRDVGRHTPIHPEYAASVLDDLAAEDVVFTVAPASRRSGSSAPRMS
ncbi:hypothetical protein [Streptomyces sp. NRRL F-2890]|uniref:hypothetical protein n=1 Tax=Streptomyces sp. NRRL F-2890 TaxID=1463845 RepID=UPI0004C6FAAA|nr:hypothetical protein [Streptomyces sp. NRRL F-2890]